MGISLFMESFKDNLLCLFGDNLLFLGIAMKISYVISTNI